MLTEDDRCLHCREPIEQSHGFCIVRHRFTCWSNPCPDSHTECEKPL